MKIVQTLLKICEKLFGNDHCEGGSFSLARSGKYDPVVMLYDLFAKCQSNTRALISCTVQSLEDRKYPIRVSFTEPDSVIREVDPDIFFGRVQFEGSGLITVYTPRTDLYL